MRVERQQRNITRAGESPSERAMRSGSYGSSGKALFPKTTTGTGAASSTDEMSDAERKKLEQELLRQEKELADKRKQEFEERQLVS